MRVQLATAITLKSEREDTTGSVRALKNAFIHVVLKCKLKMNWSVIYEINIIYVCSSEFCLRQTVLKGSLYASEQLHAEDATVHVAKWSTLLLLGIWFLTPLWNVKKKNFNILSLESLVPQMITCKDKLTMTYTLSNYMYYSLHSVSSSV